MDANQKKKKFFKKRRAWCCFRFWRSTAAGWSWSGGWILPQCLGPSPCRRSRWPYFPYRPIGGPSVAASAAWTGPSRTTWIADDRVSFPVGLVHHHETCGGVASRPRYSNSSSSSSSPFCCRGRGRAGWPAAGVSNLGGDGECAATFITIRRKETKS